MNNDTKNKKLTAEIISSLLYSWEEWGDLERDGEWEDNLQIVQEHLPHLVKAWEEYKTSIKTLNAIIESLRRIKVE